MSNCAGSSQVHMDCGTKATKHNCLSTITVYMSRALAYYISESEKFKEL